MYTHILIPTDGSPLSTRALEKALDLAKALGASVRVLSVIEPLQVFTVNPGGLQAAYAEYERRSNEEADAILSEAAEAARQRSVPCETVKVIDRDPALAIVETAGETGSDLIAMASHGRSGLKAFMLGSVAMKVLVGSKIPVLIYR